MNRSRLVATSERDGLWEWNLSSDRVHFSPRWISMIGCDDQEIGTSPEEWLRRVHPADRERVSGEIESHLSSLTAEFGVHHRMLHKNGTYRWVSCRTVVVRDDDGKALRLIGSHSDVTAEHAADPETGLPNRLLFLDRLTRSIDRSARDSQFVYTVLLIDIRRPSVDGRIVPAAGDPVIRAAARRLETLLRREEHAESLGESYVLARLSDDHLALLCDGLQRPAEAQAVAERILADLLSPFDIEGRQVFLQPSIGVAVSATGYTRTEDVLRDADAALYRARSFGGGRCEIFDTAILQSADARLQLERDLEQALDRREFLVFYQPIVSLTSNRVVGLEALARWQHPQQGMVSPLEFIPLAEKSGFIVRLGEWVLREACLQLKAWHESVPAAEDVWVSVNISSPQVRQRGFVEQVDAALRDVGLEPQHLVLELTETVAIAAPEAVKTVLMQLRGLGVRIGLDDFGTGHSSLAYLHQFPADFLKLDQSLVRGLEVRGDKSDILSSIARLGAELGLHVIAEGIETEKALAVVRSSACKSAQGFLFSRPVPADEAVDLLREAAQGAATDSANDPTPSSDNVADLISFEAGGRRRWRHPGVGVLVALATVVVIVAAGLSARASRARLTATSASSANAVNSMPNAEVRQGDASPTSNPLGPESARPAATNAPATAAEEPERSIDAGSEPVVARLPPPGSAGQASGAPSRGASGRSVKVPAPARVTSHTPVTSAAPAPAATELVFPVVHQHAFGSCRGSLVVSATGISFRPDKSKDAFTFGHNQFLASLADGLLTIKSADKTYRFAVGEGVNANGTLLTTTRMLDGIQSFR